MRTLSHTELMTVAGGHGCGKSDPVKTAKASSCMARKCAAMSTIMAMMMAHCKGKTPSAPHADIGDSDVSES